VLPAYEIPEQDRDLLECGKVLAPEFIACEKVRKMFFQIGLRLARCPSGLSFNIDACPVTR